MRLETIRGWFAPSDAYWGLERILVLAVTQKGANLGASRWA